VTKAEVRHRTDAKRVLVADDERHVVRLCEVSLQKAGFEVITAFDAREAYEKAREEQPDVLVLDAYMPANDGEIIGGVAVEGPSGMAVAKALRADPAHAQAPIIIMLARPPDAACRVLSDPIADTVTFIYKPFDPRCLVALVRDPSAQVVAWRAPGGRQIQRPRSERHPWWRWWSG
jgi:DNA-binding response OmpR family regulator